MNFSNRGVSVIGSLLGFVLIGLSSIGLAVYMGSFEQVKVSYARQSNVQFMHFELLGIMGKMITMTKTKVTSANSVTVHPEKKFGFCQVVLSDNLYSDVKDKTICPMMLKGASIHGGGTNSYNKSDRWQYFIQEGKGWVDVSSTNNCNNGQNGFVGNFRPDDFHKCVQYVRSTQATDSIFARISMQPQRLPSFKNIKTSDRDDIPVDELVFKLQSMISFPRELEPGETIYSLSKSDKYLWGTEVLDCHICDGGQCKLARFSTAAQGTAAKRSRICYHSSYAIQPQKDALEIFVEKIPPQFKRSGNKIVVDTEASSSYSAACRSRLFRCGNKTNKNDFDPVLKFQFLLNYDQPQDSYVNKMDLKITNGSQEKKHGTLFMSSDQKARVGRNKSGQDIEFTDEWPLRAGSNEITAFMADQSFLNSADPKTPHSICEDICSAGTSSYYPELTVEYGGPACGDESSQGALDKKCSKTLAAEDRKIACFQCNMKGCHRRGLKTHTAAETERSKEPQDGIVPECVMEDIIRSTADTTLISRGVEDLNNQCLKTASGGRLQAVACASDSSSFKFQKGSVQSACFLDGQTKILKGGSQGLDAGNNCLQVLREKQLVGKPDANGVWAEGVFPSISIAYNLPFTTRDAVKSGVKEHFERRGGLKATKSKDGKNYYTFDNYARFSAFLGDHKELTSSNVFVPFQRDASGMFHSGWNRFNDLQEKQTRWAFFYREPFNSISFHDANAITVSNNNDTIKDAGELPKHVNREEFLRRVRSNRPVYIKMDEDFHPDYVVSVLDNKEPNDSASDGRLALIHHLAYKGIRRIKNPAKNAYPYLCRNIKASTYKEAFVTTSYEAKDVHDGYVKCRELNSADNEDWHFIPPDSRKLWAAALQAVAPNAPRYPFPNPFSFADGIPFWTALKSEDPGYNPKKRQWKLSYNYQDMNHKDYWVSQGNDHQFLFTQETGALASPSTAWIGLMPKDSTSGGTTDKSWSWKPDWRGLIEEEPCDSPPCIWPPLDPLEPEDSDSLLFDKVSESSIGNLLAKLEDDNDLFTNIGVLSRSGRLMSVKSLREPDSLKKFNDNVTKLCRYSSSEQNLDFHRALIMTGKGESWPSGDDCSAFSSSNSESFLADTFKSIYFKIPSDVGVSNLRDLTKSDFMEVRQGLRTMIPLLAYYKAGAMHVHNTDKFCRAWKREKKRRAVGNCIVKNYNDGNLSIGGVNHGFDITKRARKSNTCHPAAYNCGRASAHFRAGYQALEEDLKEAEEEKEQKVLEKGDKEGKMNALSRSCVGTRPSCDNNQNSCSEQDEYDEACSLRDEIRDLAREIAVLTTLITQLAEEKTCADGKISAATTSSCLAAMTDDVVVKHTTSYEPDVVACSEDYITALSLNFNDPALPSTCWSLEELDPKFEFTFDDGVTENLQGEIGILGGDSSNLLKWDADAKCNEGPGVSTTKLYSIPEHCADKYVGLYDLHEDFCDDDGIDYDAQTCAILASP